MASGEPVQTRSVRVRARRAVAELAGIDMRRAAADAAAAGLSDGAIGAAVGMAPAEVTRLLSRLRRHPELLEVTPRELLLRRAAGELPTPTMLARLAGWPWTFGYADQTAPPGSENWVSGTWDDLVGEYGGLLDPGEYEALRREVLGDAGPVTAPTRRRAR